MKEIAEAVWNASMWELLGWFALGIATWILVPLLITAVVAAVAWWVLNRREK